MFDQKAIHYGEVELIPGIICDAYILNNGSAVMSERGTAELLNMDHMALSRVATKGIPKTLKLFSEEDLSVETNFIEVVAHNSPHKGRNIAVYTAETIEKLIFVYALALAHRSLRAKKAYWRKMRNSSKNSCQNGS